MRLHPDHSLVVVDLKDLEENSVCMISTCSVSSEVSLAFPKDLQLFDNYYKTHDPVTST